MSDTAANPLAPPTEERIERQRERAYFLWLDDGCPEGQADWYWERAGELLAISDNPGAGLVAPEASDPRPEEAELQDNLGEFPDRFTDQGERRGTPMTRAAELAAESGRD